MAFQRKVTPKATERNGQHMKMGDVKQTPVLTMQSCVSVVDRHAAGLSVLVDKSDATVG